MVRLWIPIFAAIALCACGGASTSISGTTTGTGASTASCVTSLIDTGIKGTAAAVARGAYSDARMSPTMDFPGTAYADAGALALKFSYWNGASFTTEVVSGDGTAAFVRLAYLPSGVPMVFWTLGANVKMAMRSTAPPQAGTWTAGVIDSGVAPRALEASVNPLGQVGLSYLTDTAATGRAKFMYCDVGCTGPSAFQSVNPENVNITAAQVGTGMAWCQSSATSYYPAITYSNSADVRFAVCRNTLANCLNAANWSFQNVVASTSVSTKLLIDPTVSGDVPKVLALGASGVVPYKMGTTACSSAPAAFTAGSAMGSANSGNQWMALMKDTTGKFHLAANESTTSVRYYNSTTTTFTSAWNAAGVVETVTLAAAEGGGAAIDPASDGIYLSYASSAAPYDIRLARVENYTAASNTSTFTRADVDVTGDLQLTAANSQLRNIAMASTSGGMPAVAYADYSIGAAAAAKLKFALRSGPQATDVWYPEQLPDTQNPEFPSLAFDSNNLPWISYFDAANNRFYLATNSSSDGSGAWSLFEFPALPSGAPIALPAANGTAVTMYNSGGTAYPTMIVIDNNAASRGVKAAMFNPGTRSWSSVATIDALGASGAAHLTADSDSSGNIAVAYDELTAAKVKYSTSANITTWSTPIAISSLNQGAGLTLRINPVTDSPAVAYFDRPGNAVYYNACSGSPASCASTGWDAQSIESAAGVSTLAAANEQILGAALVFLSDGTPYVFYPQGALASGSLRLSTNVTGSFVSALAGVGANGSLSGSAALNFGVAGWDAAATRNPAGGVTSAYIGPGNWLYSSSCGD